MGLTSGVESVGDAPRPLGPWSLFFDSILEGTFFRFWVDFGRVLGAQHGPKIDFWDVFFEVCFKHGFGIDFEPIFESSKP